MSVMSLICVAALASGVADTNAVPKARARNVPRGVVVEAAPTVAVLVPADLVDEVEPVHVVPAAVTSVETNLPVHVRIPDILARALAEAVAADVPKVVAKVLAEATEANLPSILAAVYTKLAEASAPESMPVDMIKTRLEWYERLVAVPASKAWWLLQIAKERAEKGESVEQLKLLFDKTIQDWLDEED